LRIFSKQNKIFPIFSLYHYSEIENAKSFLIGATNRIIQENTKLKFNAIVNLDNGKITISENISQSILKISKCEKTLFHSIYDNIKTNYKEENENWLVNYNYYNPDFEGSDDYIRSEFRQYFYDFFSDVALANEISSKNLNEENPIFNIKGNDIIQIHGVEDNIFDNMEDDINNLMSNVKQKFSNEKNSDKKGIL
jgi:hypothetical protein